MHIKIGDRAAMLIKQPLFDSCGDGCQNVIWVIRAVGKNFLV